MNAETVPEVSAEEGHELVEAGALLLDVREADEWEAGHAPEATWIPMGELSDASRRVARGPGASSPSAAPGAGRTPWPPRCCRRGYDAVNLDGGMRAWAAEDYDVVAVRRPPGRRHLARPPHPILSESLPGAATIAAHGASEARACRARSRRPGVSVAVAGVLAGFMAAGDHPADATPTSSGTSSSGLASARRSTRRRRRAAPTAVPRRTADRHERRERLAVPAPAPDPDRRQLGGLPLLVVRGSRQRAGRVGAGAWPRAPGASCTRSAPSAVDRRRRGCSPSHRYLSALAIAFVVVHVVAILADGFVDFGARRRARADGLDVAPARGGLGHRRHVRAARGRGHVAGPSPVVAAGVARHPHAQLRAPGAR